MLDEIDIETDPLRTAIRDAARMDETACVLARLRQAALSPDSAERIKRQASAYVAKVRKHAQRYGGLDAFLSEFKLSTAEGVVLMCLAEALLRIPDTETRDKLIREKIGGANWAAHLGQSESLFVNASTWGLMLSGDVLLLEKQTDDVEGFMRNLIARSGEPIIRSALVQGMRIMGRQFVLGRTIDEALKNADQDEAKGYTHSFDMLGEAARTMADADRYLESYTAAIRAIGQAAGPDGETFDRPGISIKLSALHPRYEISQKDRIERELVPRALSLARLAKAQNIGLTVDAEEADRLDISLDVFQALYLHPTMKGWDGLGLAVQAYQKRAIPVLDWLANLAKNAGWRIPVRLVKGAYWDTEIKRAQELGLNGYPVFTRKASTDVSYLACVKHLVQSPALFYPAFATHNAHTIAAIQELVSGPYEFQRLHGMGQALYDQIVTPDGPKCRIYAPVGSHEDLLAYLVRRLLENGANTSFVNRIADDELPIEAVVSDPIEKTRNREGTPHPAIPLPRNLFPSGRLNAAGLDLSDPAVLSQLKRDLGAYRTRQWEAGPKIDGLPFSGDGAPVKNPANENDIVGAVTCASLKQAHDALRMAETAQPGWDRTPAHERALCLERAADLFEANAAELMALCIREAGKTLPDALAEIREAVDFLRYYAERVRADFQTPVTLPGPTGELNSLRLHGRGVFVCISPWNFPLAIFTGQVAAALGAGNAVIAKPAEQTPLIAARAVSLLHDAGVPRGALHLLPGDGPEIGAALVSAENIAGVAFTGSTETAKTINRLLAARAGPIVPFIAETGGQNAMIVDSSALPEQVVRDAVESAFRSAGQRCSALRVMYVQDEIAPRVIEMLAGAMQELRVGDPSQFSTDVGPVIDKAALSRLQAHIKNMRQTARFIGKTPLAKRAGCFVAPHAFEISSVTELPGEVFGPVLHVIRYADDDLSKVINEINETGFGLTLGNHSRIDSTVNHILSRAKVGNIYVNRNQIGAVVGVQPFGGEGLSGTGPKAGGPRYLHRFATERTHTIDMTAAGGNTDLLSLTPDADEDTA